MVLGYVDRAKVENEVDHSIQKVGKTYNGANVMLLTRLLIMHTDSCIVVEFTATQTGKIQAGSKKQKTRVSLIAAAETTSHCNGSLARPSNLYTEWCEALVVKKLQEIIIWACYLGRASFCSYSVAGHAICVQKKGSCLSPAKPTHSRKLKPELYSLVIWQVK